MGTMETAEESELRTCRPECRKITLDFHLVGRIIEPFRKQEWTARAMPDTPLRCPQCGSNKFVVPDPATNDALVHCGYCGAEIGPWGEVRVGILDEVKEETAARKAKRGAA